MLIAANHFEREMEGEVVLSPWLVGRQTRARKATTARNMLHIVLHPICSFIKIGMRLLLYILVHMVLKKIHGYRLGYINFILYSASLNWQ